MGKNAEIGVAWVLAVLAGMLIVYLSASFVFWNVNPFDWGKVGRGAALAMSWGWLILVSALALRRYAE